MTKVRTMLAGAVLSMTAVAASASAQSDGKALYNENCRTCHGVTGVPPKAMKSKFPKIAAFDAAFVAARSDDSLVKVLAKAKNENMTSFKDKLNHDEAEAIAKYVRELGTKTR